MWRTEIAKLTKAESYLLSKSNITFDNYSTEVKNVKHRKALPRLCARARARMRVYATPYFLLDFRLSSSVLNSNATYFPYKGGTHIKVIPI